MFERFIEKARDVVTFAQDEARALKHNYIGTEHLLLGLLRVDGSPGQTVLTELGVDLEDVRMDVGRIVGQGDEVTTGQIPFTPRAKKVLELSLREALSLGQNYIGTEHILLGLVRENEGVAARILSEKEISVEALRNKVIDYIRLQGQAVRRAADNDRSQRENRFALRHKISTLKDEALDAGFVELAAELRAIERDMT